MENWQHIKGRTAFYYGLLATGLNSTIAKGKGFQAKTSLSVLHFPVLIEFPTIFSIVQHELKEFEEQEVFVNGAMREDFRAFPRNTAYNYIMLSNYLAVVAFK